MPRSALRRSGSAKLGESASVAQRKSTSVLRSWLGVRIPPGARHDENGVVPGGNPGTTPLFLLQPVIGGG